MLCRYQSVFSGLSILLWWIQVTAKGTLMQMVAADWLKSDKREDDLGSRPGGIVQVLLIIELLLIDFLPSLTSSD